MRLDSCTFHNMGPFDDFKLDLRALDEENKLIALVGLNGSGKSFCLEAAMAGACYREMPTHGQLVKRGTARDSWLESRLHYGKDWRIKQLVDAVTQKGETLVLDGEGNAIPELPTLSVAKFDGWAARHLPDPDVVFASIFAAQQSEGFVKMLSAQRIDVLLRVIGVARIERMAVAARKLRDACSGELKATVQRIGDARGDSPLVLDAETAWIVAGQTVETLDAALVTARRELGDAEDEARSLADLAEKNAEAELAATKLAADLERARAKVTLEAERVKNNRDTLAKGEEIRAARAALEALTAEAPLLEAELAAVAKPFDEQSGAISAELASAQQALAAREAGANALALQLKAATEALRAATERIARVRARLADEPAVRAAQGAAEAKREALAEVNALADEAELALAALNGTTRAGAAGRIAGLRGWLEEIRDLPGARVDEGSGLAAHALANDDAAARTDLEFPAKLAAAEQALKAARARAATLNTELSALDKQAARAPEMATARAELTEAEAQEQAAAVQRDALRTQGEAAAELVAAARRVRESVDLKVQEAAEARARAEPLVRAAVVVKQTEAAARRAEIEPTAKLYDRLIAADARLVEIEPILEAARAELARLEAQSSATPAPTIPKAAPDVAAYRKTVDDLERQAREALGSVAVAQQTLTASKATALKVAGLLAEQVALEADLADWTRLSLDLGRSGLQSAEVDSAGPELTELTNDLLRTCHGPRFSVSVDTQRLDSTGNKTIDECLIQVIDTVACTEKEVRMHSGGERALLGTAISLALTMLACRRAGFDRPTIIRDETGANLDEENWPAWVAMLRRAIAVTGADKLVIVEHRPEVIAMADAVIRIPNLREAA